MASFMWTSTANVSYKIKEKRGRESERELVTVEVGSLQTLRLEYNKTDIAGKTLRKIKPGSGFYFESSMFHSLPLLHIKGYQPDSFSDCFLKVSTDFRHSFRLLF